MPKSLKRLTPTILHKAESAGKGSGWYSLCLMGYLPVDIALYADPPVFANDIVQRVRQHASTHSLPLPLSCAPKRRQRQPAPVDDWRSAFCSTVMRTGMVLSLSQPMLEYLCATADGVTWDRSAIGGSTGVAPCNTLATAGSLEKRGLIRRKPTISNRKIGDSFYELTEAGQAVIDLLKCTGVFVKADEAIKRNSK